MTSSSTVSSSTDKKTGETTSIREQQGCECSCCCPEAARWVCLVGITAALGLLAFQIVRSSTKSSDSEA